MARRSTSRSRTRTRSRSTAKRSYSRSGYTRRAARPAKRAVRRRTASRAPAAIRLEIVTSPQPANPIAGAMAERAKETKPKRAKF